MKMHSGLLLVVGLVSLLFLAVGAGFAQLTEGGRDTIFIGSINIQPSVRQLARNEGSELALDRIAQSLETQFIQAVSATRVFQMVDRRRLEELQTEQAFSEVWVDPSDKRAARFFKMAGARWAFFPEIDGFQVRTDTVRFQVGRESMTRRYFLSALVQIVDTSTGELLPDVPSIQLEEVETIEMARPGQTRVSDAVLVGLARKMAGGLSQEAVSTLRPARILAITGEQIMINRGSEAGFVPGVPVEIYAYQSVVDEETGEVFRNEIPVGQATISRGDRRQSYGRITGEDLGIATGCIVKPLRAPAGPPPLVPATWSGGREETGTEIAPRRQTPDTPGSSDRPLSW